ncbi:MAG: hypothetical protein E6Q97_36655 [Desulfurellales bacterium]|nr:MAG: hypothetical protein E6Q97_36655 [Desulfurellales bacterium]
MASFSNAEIQEIKNYLGYGNLTADARPYFDIAMTFEDVIQTNVDDWGKTYVTGTILVNIRACDTAMAPSALTPRMTFEVGCEGARPNPNELKDLNRLRSHWIGLLSQTLKVPVFKMNTGNCITQG